MAERPRFDQIDAWGMTHAGKVRPDNQDHFFLGSLTRGVTVERTSVSGFETDPPLQRLASLGVVADGVGGRAGGETAARIAVEGLVSAVSGSFHRAELAEGSDPEVFTRLLHDAALDCHESLLARAEAVGDERAFSTTLTLFLGLWPHAYLLQVGDSRCYVFQDGELSQVTRDQTLAEALVESGALTRTAAERTRWANVLASAIGGEEAAPVVNRVVRTWGTVVLLCSDGLTKHVSDERIAERLAGMTDARQACEGLVQDALDDGGTDNITVVVGRTVRQE